MKKNRLVFILVLVVFMVDPAVCRNATENEKKHIWAASFKGSSESSLKSWDETDEDFQGGILREELWKRTRKNDFREGIVDVFEKTEGDFRLRMRADTVGTVDSSVKYQGVRSRRPLTFEQGRIICFDVDWNNQTNGSYLTAGLYLCPTLTDENPGDEPDWIAFEYVGVPPGRNARFQITKRQRGSFQFLFTEGWPEEQRTGRKIGNQHVELLIDGKRLIVRENEKEIFRTEDHGVDLIQAYLYVQMSSHSNYRAREIYFDNIGVRSIQ